MLNKCMEFILFKKIRIKDRTTMIKSRTNHYLKDVPVSIRCQELKVSDFQYVNVFCILGVYEIVQLASLETENIASFRLGIEQIEIERNR